MEASQSVTLALYVQYILLAVPLYHCNNTTVDSMYVLIKTCTQLYILSPALGISKGHRTSISI